MSLKIAIIIERADIKLGGAERSVMELRAALSAIGNQVDILAAKGKATGKNIHILFPNNTSKRINFFTFEETLAKFLAENKYDIIHSVLPFDFADVYQPRGGTYAETIIRNAVSYQNTFVEFYKKTFSVLNSRRTTLLRAERKLSQKENKPLIAALSKYVSEQFISHYNTNPEKISVIANGVKIQKHIDKTQADKIRSQVLAGLGLKEADNPVFLFFAANNFRLKGLPTLINAMRIAIDAKTERPIYLIVAGNDKSKKCYNLANSIIPKNIIFLGSLGNIYDTLSVMDIAVLPTFYDPSSRFILEALAAGKPVITTKYNGACDLFTDNRHGIIIKNPQDASELAKAIIHFTNTENINNASNAIIDDKLIENISITRVAQELTKLYELIITKKGIN